MKTAPAEAPKKSMARAVNLYVLDRIERGRLVWRGWLHDESHPLENACASRWTAGYDDTCHAAAAPG